MIQWKKYGTVHIGTTDCGLRFEVSRRRGDRCWSLQVRRGEWSTGYQFVRAAKVAAKVAAIEHARDALAEARAKRAGKTVQP